MSPQMLTWIRRDVLQCKTCKGKGTVECYRDADEACLECQAKRVLLAAYDNSEAELQAAAQKLDSLNAKYVELDLKQRDTQAELDCALTESVAAANRVREWKERADAISLISERHRTERDRALSELAEARKALELRTGCVKCKGVGKITKHGSGHIHYETDAGEECPPWHYQTIPCSCTAVQQP